MIGNLIGFSGKMGAGKDTYALELKNHFNKQGSEVAFYSFAKPLREETDNLLESIRQGKTTEELANLFRVGQEKIQFFRKMIQPILLTDFSSYDRHPIIRQALQFWGTDVRRAQDRNYWVLLGKEQISRLMNRGKNVLVTDIRFLNELECIQELGGTAILLLASFDERRKRILERDGIDLVESQSATAHSSEKQEFPMERFQAIIDTEAGSIQQVTETILERLKI